MNDEIAAPNVFLVDRDGAAVGTCPLADALRTALEAGLELVEVQPGADPPVCKLMPAEQIWTGRADAEPREMRALTFRPGAAQADTELRLRHARAFLVSGGAVELRVERGDAARELLARLIDRLDDVGTPKRRERYTDREIVQTLEPCAPADQEE